MKTIKELYAEKNQFNHNEKSRRYNIENLMIIKIEALKDVIKLIDEDIKLVEQLYKDNITTREQFKAQISTIKEIKARIEG